MTKSSSGAGSQVIPLTQVVNTDVHFGPAGHPAGHLFAHEEIRMSAQRFRRVNRGHDPSGDDGHAQLLAAGINLVRGVVAFPRNAVEDGNVEHS